MMGWLSTLAQHLDEDLVRVVVVATRGSVPREAGACMLVGRQTLLGTIGGGHLEFRATAIARDMLASRAATRLDRFTLGATLGQCCGGAVELWFERWSAADLPWVEQALTQRHQHAIDASSAAACVLATRLASAEPGAEHGAQAGAVQGPQRALRTASTHDRLPQRTATHFLESIAPTTAPLYLFGAGHVAQALVRVLEGLPLAITWIDSRADLFPDILMSGQQEFKPQESANPITVRIVDAALDEAANEVRHAPAGTHYLIMTHSHDLDFAICRAALARGDAASVGLIGSATKAARFRHRLAAQGIDCSGLTCPIGLLPSGNKLPAAIAISVAAQLLERLEQSAALQAPATRRAQA